MGESERKPQPFPPPLEPDDEEEEEPQSSLSDPVVEREAQQALKEIEEEIEEEHPTRPAQHHVPSGPQPTFIDKAWDVQEKVENRLKRIGHGRYGRVLKMARKPEPEEFQKASQITAIGIAILGAMGFAIFLLMTWIMGLLNVK